MLQNLVAEVAGGIGIALAAVAAIWAWTAKVRKDATQTERERIRAQQADEAARQADRNTAIDTGMAAADDAAVARELRRHVRPPDA
jgi:uncharacterized iron-regulated membrane protein